MAKLAGPFCCKTHWPRPATPNTSSATAHPMAQVTLLLHRTRSASATTLENPFHCGPRCAQPPSRRSSQAGSLLDCFCTGGDAMCAVRTGHLCKGRNKNTGTQQQKTNQTPLVTGSCRRKCSKVLKLLRVSIGLGAMRLIAMSWSQSFHAIAKAGEAVACGEQMPVVLIAFRCAIRRLTRLPQQREQMRTFRANPITAKPTGVQQMCKVLS